jgi:hypothetical protein
MKRFLATILLVTYLAFSSGVVINYHFCMNELASATLFEKDQDVCGSCGMHNDNNGCCHDEVVVIKAEDDQNAVSTLHYAVKAPGAEWPQVPSISLLQNFDPTGYTHVVPPGPPLLTDQKLYLQNRVFRI